MKNDPRRYLTGDSGSAAPGRKVHITVQIVISLLFLSTVSYARTERDHFEFSLICESCHSEIYREWGTSNHAVSWEDSLFQDMYAAVKAKNVEVECLSCHAPIAWYSEDKKVMEGISREGINCDYCHTLFPEKGSGRVMGFKARPGKTKISRKTEGTSIYHETESEEVFGSDLFCALCHNFRNRYGVLIYSEFESWKASNFSKRGVTCRDCHMPESTRAASNYGPVRDDTSDHRFEGWRSMKMLRKACTFEASVTVSLDSVRIRTAVYNVGAGHKFPGGSPLRELVISFLGMDEFGEEIFEDTQLRYGIDLEVPEGDSLNLWEARSILRDTRIDPGERRRDTSSFALTDNLDSIDVSLLYYPIPLKLVEERELEMEPIVIYSKLLKIK